MANIRSAEKQRRQAEKRKERNRASKSKLKGALKKARASVASGTDAVKDVLSSTFSQIDKAAKKGIIKPKPADRSKSRLAAASERTAAR